MNIGLGPIIPQQTHARPGQVEIQWKCRTRHHDCTGQDWRRHSFVDAELAAQFVSGHNASDPHFVYRVRA